MSRKLKKGDVIDFTTRKRIDYTKSLVKCPICGKIGEKNSGKAGDMYVHKYKIRDVGGLLVGEIKESCVVPKAVTAAKPVCAICEKKIRASHYVILAEGQAIHTNCFIKQLPAELKELEGDEDVDKTIKVAVDQIKKQLDERGERVYE